MAENEDRRRDFERLNVSTFEGFDAEYEYDNWSSEQRHTRQARRI